MRAFSVAHSSPLGCRRCVVQPRAGLCVARAEADQTTYPRLFDELTDCIDDVKRAPRSMSLEASGAVMEAMKALKEAEAIPKWGAGLGGELMRRNVMAGELRQVGVLNPEQIAIPSVRNDLAFLVTVVGTTSFLAVAASFLPGDWGFFGSYLIGSISFIVLGIGSTNPGILTFLIDKFSQVFPDYRDRVLTHESAHFLLGYLMGCPVLNYDLAIGREHIDFADAKLQKRLFQTQLTDDEVNELAVMSMAGVAAEAQTFDEVMGQGADLIDLQKILNRSQTKLSNMQQQNMTRWAVWQASVLLRKYKAEWDALKNAMSTGQTITTCIRAIETSKFTQS